MMQCLVLHQSDSLLQLESRDLLEPVEKEVLIQLQAAALNRRDFWITQGQYPGIQLPSVLGSDGAGVVIQIGDQVETTNVGDEVLINPGWDWGEDPSAQDPRFRILGMPDDGTLATHVVVPAQYVRTKPAALSWQEAAALPLAGVTAYRSCFYRGALTQNDRVLITGIGGGVATMALGFATAAGAQVAVTSSSQEKLARAASLGAAAGFLYTDDDWTKQCRASFGAPTLIVDGAGGAGYRQLVDLLAPGGRLVNYGATAGPPPKFDLFKVFWKQLNLIGSTMGTPADFQAMVDFVDQKGVRPVIDQTFALSDGNEAIKRLAGANHFGKVVVDCRSEA